MSKAMKAEQAVTVQNETQVIKKFNIQAVAIVQEGIEVNRIEGLPEEFKRAVSHSGFPPSPQWEHPGDALFGYFVTMREGIGPNSSRLYELSVPRKGEDPVTVAVWGSAALDRIFDSVFPPIKSGDKVGMIFLGEKPTKRGLNPVKLFDVRVVYQDGSQSRTATS
jgi:hypothetical protein